MTKTITICKIDGCEKKNFGQGYCSKHYYRFRKYGDPHKYQAVERDDERAFWSKVDKSGDCWMWTAAIARNGYPRFRRNLYGHRFAWEIANGPIPEGMQVDHICHVRGCVRPDHLRIVTQKQNMENHDGPKRNSKSGVRGVCWHPQTGKWRPTVRHDGVVHYVGLFDDLAEAESAVIAKRNELHSHNDHDRGAAA